MRHVIWLVALVAACTDEVSITSGVCGNWVLDPGEDCDRPGGACTSECRIACDPSQRASACGSADAIDGTCCPSGSICGVDNVCHTPTGTVQPSELVVPFAVDTLTFADIDGDLIADAVGVSPTSAQVRYGALATPLQTLASTPVPPSSSSQVGFGDFDGDGRIDVAIPTQSGLFALSTKTGTPKPITFPAVTLPGVRHERVASGAVPTLFGTVAGFVELDFVASPAQGESPYQLNLFVTPTFTVPTVGIVDGDHAPCGVANLSASVLRGHGLHPFIDDKAVRVPLLVGRTAVGVCVSIADPHTALPVGAIGSYAIPEAVLGGANYHLSTTGETFFANLVTAKGSCPDLVVPVFDTNNSPFSAVLHGKGTVNADQCTIDTTVPPVILAGKPLAAIDIVGSTSSLITSAGIYVSVTGGTLSMPSTRPWTYAVVGDLEGDGMQDFVTMGSANDVEVFRQRPPVVFLGVMPEFVDLLISTSDPVADVALGNFDGDNGGDVAITTVDDNGDGELSIAWGSVDTTFTVSDIGALPEFRAMTSTNILDVSMPPNLDHNDDLVIALGGANTGDPSDPALIVTEYGSTSRALTAPFVDTSTFGQMQANPTPLHGAGVLAEIGSFGVNGAPGVFALFQPSPAGLTILTQPPPDNISMLDLTYQSFGSFTPSAEALASMVCPTDATAGTSADTAFCPANAAFARIVQGSGDVLLALRTDAEAEPRSQCAAYFVATPGAPPSLTTMSCASLAPAASTATDDATKAAYAALSGVGRLGAVYNIDGKVRLEVDTTKRHTEQAFLWQLDVVGGVPQLSNPIAVDTEIENSGLLPAGARAFCTDVGEVELGHRTIGAVTYGASLEELVAMCNVLSAGVYTTSVFARYTDPGGGTPHYEQLVDLHEDIETRVREGDVNGDGLTDIIYTVGSSTSGRQDMHVLLQCDTHQTGCIGGGS